MGLPSPPERRSVASLGGQFVWTIWDRREWILTFRATRTGYSVDVYVAEHATLDLELPAISLSGTVRADRTDRPVAGGWVRLARVDASADSLPVVLGAPIASDGSFRFEGLAKGEYIVRISHRDFGDVSRRLHIAGREAVEFRLESDHGGGDGRAGVVESERQRPAQGKD